MRLQPARWLCASAIRPIRPYLACVVCAGASCALEDRRSTSFCSKPRLARCAFPSSAWRAKKTGPAVLQTAEQAMAQPCGRGWLDIQRYAVEACEALGDEFDRVSEAVRTQLWLLLNDFPDLPERTLDDDTPAANGATLDWIRSLGEDGLPVPPKATNGHDDEDDEPDAWEIAQRALQRGRPDEALSVLRRQLGRETSERARFARQVQMARVCLTIEERSRRAADSRRCRGRDRASRSDRVGRRGNGGRAARAAAPLPSQGAA
ncbi:MAG: type VI secretion system domain-containing protein [Bryobacterales bacterium]